MSNDSIPTRARILVTARELLEAGKPKGTRMSDIARRAGVSRQAVYLHFKNRADLLAEVTRDMDRAFDVEARLVPSREASTGRERLRAFITFWGEYLPHIAPVARALIAMQESDAEAERAWQQRMQDVREGCEAAVRALASDSDLAEVWTVDSATDMLWSMLSVETWFKLHETCGWSKTDYITRMQNAALSTFTRRLEP
ncbi:TetR/AcrR family transcriptional regulator [Amaricoccus macauensis]|uniref:TetR/AcrR family transcriptional regulator n=1 Tax=Amaricoccus macauensis TaxID=57001 RepID=UPI003C7E2C10